MIMKELLKKQKFFGSKLGTIRGGSPFNLYPIIRLKFKRNQYQFQQEKNLEGENRINDEQEQQKIIYENQQ